MGEQGQEFELRLLSQEMFDIRNKNLNWLNYNLGQLQHVRTEVLAKVLTGPDWTPLKQSKRLWRDSLQLKLRCPC